MKYNIYNKILINNEFELLGFNSLQIESDINNLTDTCKIILPIKNFEFIDSNNLIYHSNELDILLKVNDFITISLCYYDNINITKEFLDSVINPYQFIGNISSFNAKDDLLEVICENMMSEYKLKKIQISYSNIKLKDLILSLTTDLPNSTDILSKIEIANQDSIDLGKLRIDNYVTAAEIFQNIKDKYKLFIYFKNIIEKDGINYKTTPYLFAGLKYPLVDSDGLFKLIRTINYKYPYYDTDIPTENVEYYNPIIQNNLKYNNFNKKNDLIVIGTSKQDNSNTPFKYGYAWVNIGSSNEELKVLTDTTTPSLKEYVDIKKVKIDVNIPNVTAQYLIEFIKNIFDSYKDYGLEGDILVLGEPTVFIGDKVKLKIENYKNSNQYTIETYYIDKVITTVDESNGYQQRLTLGNKTI